MDERASPIYRASLGTLLAVLSVAPFLWWTPDALLAAFRESAAAAGILALLGTTCAVVAGSGLRDRRPVRLASSVVIAAAVLLAPPVAWTVALISALPALGRGVLGRDGLGPARIGGLLLATTIAAESHARLPWTLGPADALGVLPVLPPFLLLLLGVTVLDELFAALPGPRDEPLDPTRVGREAVTLPVAWLLARTLVERDWLLAAAAVILLVAAQIALDRLARAEAGRRAAHGDLAHRVSELDTLHAIGREIAASVNPQRVVRIIDREVRKILEVDTFVLALAGREEAGLRTAYRRGNDGPPDVGSQPVLGGPMLWVAEEKRARRIDDLSREAPGSRLPRDLTRPGMRSAIVVPMIVEERVIGVLCVQSARPGAYDDHALALLTTIAQQAAVAIENARHYQLATVDSLTGYFVRDHFFDRLEEEFRRVERYGGQFSVLMVDLDGFKSINDRYGHLAGDRYLHGVADTIRSELRAADICCRYGGDEFAFLLPETGLEAARSIAERIRTAVAEKLIGDQGTVLRATVSIGLSTFPDHPAEDVRALLRNADEALYEAKRTGRDRVVPYAA